MKTNFVVAVGIAFQTEMNKKETCNRKSIRKKKKVKDLQWKGEFYIHVPFSEKSDEASEYNSVFFSHSSPFFIQTIIMDHTIRIRRRRRKRTHSFNIQRTAIRLPKRETFEQRFSDMFKRNIVKEQRGKITSF